jgi:hypothetical protein
MFSKTIGAAVKIAGPVAKTLNMGTPEYDRRIFVFQKDIVSILENNCRKLA